MKLPTDKKERTQMLILMGIVAVAVIYLFLAFMIMPLINTRREMPPEIEQFDLKIEQAQTVLSSVSNNLERYNAAVANINAVAEEYLLQPVLGSYILEAERLIEEQARAVGVAVAGYREDGIRDLPKPRSRQAGNRLRSYTAIVNLSAGYEDMLRLINVLENSNPYLSVLEIQIIEQPRTPLVHDVRFKVQWPIWGGVEELPAWRTE